MVNPPLDWLAEMDAAEFKRWFKGSPVERTRRKRLHRNVAIAMGNSGDPRFLAQLEAWAAMPTTQCWPRPRSGRSAACRRPDLSETRSPTRPIVIDQRERTR